MKIFFSFKFQEDKYLLRKQTWQLNQLHVFLETDASKNTNNVQLLPKCWEKKIEEKRESEKRSAEKSNFGLQKKVGVLVLLQ